MKTAKEKQTLIYIVVSFLVCVIFNRALDNEFHSFILTEQRRALNVNKDNKENLNLRKTQFGESPPISDNHSVDSPYKYNLNLGEKLTRLTFKDAFIRKDGTYLIFSDEHGFHPYCKTLSEKKNRIKRIHLFAGNCALFDKTFGNRLATWYGIKQAANAMGVPAYFSCKRGPKEAPNGAAYFMQISSRGEVVGPPPKNEQGKTLSVEEVCAACYNKFCTWHTANLSMGAEDMISDWRLLASQSSIPEDDHDDAVIHLRLGDAIVARNGFNEAKGVFPHATYVNLIKQAEDERGPIRSIGVVTAPFKGGFVRPGYDSGSVSKSEMVARDLLDALQRAFPAARIRLHNRPKQTIMDSLVRLVEAKHVSICGCSTFCPYPVLATRGIGFVYNPTHGQNNWVKPVARRYDNFRTFDTPMLNMVVIENAKTGEKLDDAELLAWMRIQSPDAGNVDIVDHPIIRQRPEEECRHGEFFTVVQQRQKVTGSPTQVASRSLFNVLRHTSGHIIWNDEVAFEFEKILIAGGSLSPVDHPHSAEDVVLALEETGLDVSKSRVAVVSGAKSPWAEYVLRLLGASSVTSVAYNEPIVCGIDWIEPKTVSSFESEVGVYNLLISFTGIEHFGLGKDGNPRNVDEDIIMVNRMHKALYPGGYLLLAVPTWANAFTFPEYRTYDSERLEILLDRRFELVGHVWDGHIGGPDQGHGPKLYPEPSEVKVHGWQHRHVLILKKLA